MTSVLVTGGAGFIGSHLVEYLLSTRDDLRVVTLDKLTYAGSLANLDSVLKASRHHFVQGDINDRDLLDELFQRYKLDGVIHLAAESHVDNSIARPSDFITTNINGTFTLLEAARAYWTGQRNLGTARFHHVSTDEVFGSLGATGTFTETSPYDPRSPYSASKAASDHIVRAFHHTYGMNTVITNCSNNFGPRQHDEKLIPTVIRSALRGTPIGIYGAGINIRDWLFVTDHCRALELVFRKGKAGETYVVGTRNEWNNLDLARQICALLDRLAPRAGTKHADSIAFVTDRPGHDLRYAIDPSKLERELAFSVTRSFHEALEDTIRWYIARYA